MPLNNTTMPLNNTTMPAIHTLQVWFLYSAITGYLLYYCTRPKLEASIPRTVYGWFLGEAYGMVQGYGGGCNMCGIGIGLGPHTSADVNRDRLSELDRDQRGKKRSTLPHFHTDMLLHPPNVVGMHRVSVAVGVIGYALLLFEVSGGQGR